MMNRNFFCLGISIFALLCTFVGHSLCLAAADYEIWAGDEDLLDIPLAYYNVDEYGYVKLGRASGVATFHGDYQYYVVAVTNQLYLDAVQGSDGYFYGEEGGAHLVTGNVFDWDNAVGPTNDQYAVLGGEGSENFTSYFRFTNPGTWASITVYALSESPLNLHFKVDSMADHVWGHEWPVGETVTVTRVGPPDEHIGEAVVNEWGDWHLYSPLNIQAHDLIRAESDTVLKEHVVTELQITEVNHTNNTLRGMAQKGTWVHVNVWYEDASRDVPVDEHGEWLLDFNEPAGEEYWERAINLEPGMRGAAIQHDADGDETHVYWRLPDPVIRVNLLRNYVRGEGWPSGAVIEITVGDPGDPYIFATVQADHNGYWWFDPDEDYRIRAGDMITADDGTYERSMTVASLSVTGADTGANTLSGTGPSNVWMLVRVGEITVEAQANNDGEWTGDLGAEGIDVEEGTDGYVYFYDENGNSTYIFWRYHTLDVEEIALIWVQWEDLYHFFVLEISGKGILGARVRTPSEQWYELQSDDWELEWWEYGEHGESIEALDAKYPSGGGGKRKRDRFGSRKRDHLKRG